MSAALNRPPVEMVRRALSHITSADQEVRIIMAMSVKSMLSEPGLSTWMEWDSWATNSSESESSRLWSSLPDYKGAVVGDLFKRARRHGFDPQGLEFWEPNPESQAFMGVCMDEEDGNKENGIHAYRPAPSRESNFSPIRACDFLAETPEPIEYILDDYLPTGSLVLVAGKPKEGKTTLVYEGAVAIANGNAFLGRTTKKSGVLILAVEEHQRDVQMRLHNLGAENLQNLYLKVGPLPLSPTLFGEVLDFIQTNNIKLVVIDTLAAFWKVENENDASQITKAVKPLLQLARESGACVLLIHHARKSEGAHGDEIRGSGALFGLVDVALIMKRHGTGNQRLLLAESRYPETPSELVLELRDGVGYVALGDTAAVSKTAKIEKLLGVVTDTWQDVEAIRKAIAISIREAQRLLAQMVKEGKIIREGEGVRGDPYRFKKHSIRAGGESIAHESNSKVIGDIV